MRHWRTGRWRRGFSRDERGVTAVEFALLAAPFFALLFAILETCLIFFGSVSLETGMSEAARLIRTGQVQADGLTQDDVRTAICDKIFMSCDDSLRIDVRTFDSFTNVNFTDPLDEDGDLRETMSFNPGGAGDIVLVRAFYVWDVITPLMGIGMANMNGNAHLLVASAAFRNEPFADLMEEE